MAGLDDIYAQIPTSEIASKLGTDEEQVNGAIHTLVPALLGGLHENAEDPEHASKIEEAANTHAASGLLDAGAGASEDDGHQAVATLFGGNDTNQVASALSAGGAGDSQLIKQLLPIVLPIVLAYIGKQLTPGGAAKEEAPAKSDGGLGDVLGSILSGGSGDKGLGGILGSVLGGGKNGGLGSILGGMLGGKK